jgi:hypothetical protein
MSDIERASVNKIIEYYRTKHPHVPDRNVEFFRRYILGVLAEQRNLRTAAGKWMNAKLRKPNSTPNNLPPLDPLPS